MDGLGTDGPGDGIIMGLGMGLGVGGSMEWDGGLGAGRLGDVL